MSHLEVNRFLKLLNLNIQSLTSPIGNIDLLVPRCLNWERTSPSKVQASSMSLCPYPHTLPTCSLRFVDPCCPNDSLVYSRHRLSPTRILRPPTGRDWQMTPTIRIVGTFLCVWTPSVEPRPRETTYQLAKVKPSSPLYQENCRWACMCRKLSGDEETKSTMRSRLVQ